MTQLEPRTKLERQILDMQKDSLTGKRRQHIAGVVEVAVELALRFGIDPQKARLAALMHDHCREWKPELLLRHARVAGLPVSAAAEATPMLLHGPVAADVFRKNFGFTDDEVLHAVEVHTGGCPEPGNLDLVLMAADFMEPGRKYMTPELGAELRQETSLEALVLRCAKLKEARGGGGNEVLRQRMLENLESRIQNRLAK